jgi:hypothetical protein
MARKRTKTSDFTALKGNTPVYKHEQWELAARCLDGLAAFFEAKVSSVDDAGILEPNDILEGLFFGAGTDKKKWRIKTNSNDLVIQENTGSAASPTWATRATFNATNGLDHGALSGLTDDDHTQYILVAGTRAFTGNQAMGSNKLTGLAAGSTAGDSVRFEQVITEDGANPFTGNQAMGSNKLTGLAAGTAAADAVRFDQLVAAATGNLIINGNFNVWQRGATTFNQMTDGQYSADRWRFEKPAGAGEIDADRVSSGPSTLSSSKYQLKLTLDTQDASLAATDLYGIEQRIEGYDCQPLMLGTANATNITVQFWVKSSLAGTYSFSLANAALDRSYVTNYTIAAADTWEQITLTIAGDTSGTWINDKGVGLACRWSLGAGANYLGTADTWQGADDWGVSGDADWMGQVAGAGKTFQLAQVQVEVGAVANPFIIANFRDELARCQAYFCKTFDYLVAPAQNTGDRNGCIGTDSAGAGSWCDWRYPVTMRGTPTITTYNPNAADALWRDEPNSASASVVTNPSTGDTAAVIGFTGGADNTNYVIHDSADAEL